MLMQVTFSPLPVRKEREPDIEHRRRPGRDARATDHLRHHAADKEIPVRKETPAQVAAEEMQPVVERAKHAHQRCRLFCREMQMLRRVEDQRRVKNGEAERRKDLNEEEHGRSLRSRGEKAFDRRHRALLSLAAPGDVKPAMMPEVKRRRVSLSAEKCQDLLREQAAALHEGSARKRIRLQWPAARPRNRQSGTDVKTDVGRAGVSSPLPTSLRPRGSPR